jgi:hypothetical protein
MDPKQAIDKAIREMQTGVCEDCGQEITYGENGGRQCGCNPANFCHASID